MLPVDAGAQRYWPESVQRVIAEQWRIVSAEGAALATLVEASKDVGGETVVQGVVDAARSPARPFEVRIEAIALLASAIAPGRLVARDEMMRVAGGPGPDCAGSTVFTAGDTLRVCADVGRVMIVSSVDGDERIASSLDAAVRDTVRALFRALAELDPDPRIQRVASLFVRVTLPPGPPRGAGVREQAPPPGTPSTNAP